MFKKFIFLLIVIFAGNSFAQDDSYEKPFYKKRRPGIMRFYTLNAPTEDSAEKFDRFNTNFHYDSWLGDVNGVKTKLYSIGHGINLMFDIPFSKTSRFGIGIGFGYTHFSIRHDGALSIQTPLSTEPIKQFTRLEPQLAEGRWVNRTVFNNLEIPFEFRIRSQKERPKFKFYPGFKVGYTLGEYHKWKIEDRKYIDYNFLDVNPLHYGPTIRLGMNNIMIFGYYDLAMLLKNESSSKLNLFSVGVSIGWF
jgi:hypothetical protein